jgi:hypothetical protein
MHCFDTETENLYMWKAGKGSKAGMGLTVEHWCQQVLLIKLWEMSSCEQIWTLYLQEVALGAVHGETMQCSRWE